MIATFIDSLLARMSAKRHTSPPADSNIRYIDTPVGTVRVYDSGSTMPCVVMVPDGPNVIEHYEALIHLLSKTLRVVCFDMPGFGHSPPRHTYRHSLDQGAQAVLGVLDGLGIDKATLAFSCANGFYALRTARMAPERIVNLVLSQTPSLTAMHAWTARVIPGLLRVPVVGQIAAWIFRKKAAASWYGVALPKTTDPQPFRKKSLDALSDGACFCLAGVVQGLAKEEMASLCGITVPCTMIWGEKDRSHQHTDPGSLHECVPHADIVRFRDCGHFPDIEQPGRFAEILMDRIAITGYPAFAERRDRPA
ncbi:pimeloyl-ACP methyl ester carboxylesterase [Luteibacter rhizovicinus]|uniref:Pimeloyl-ACP methyl ester carboxylesterase n=1 Tax=Luteibacter rhizovicinus TaxID=242606 RepID=A0A4R3YQ01_9GAMM|nr:alpha/beta hydrolase [Luteibacter rhizovicinus]TCV93264.1 pimeloyl-ACP methyl ester carboxylesterase [Luteibacter rhizovicinus]